MLESFLFCFKNKNSTTIHYQSIIKISKSFLCFKAIKKGCFSSPTISSTSEKMMIKKFKKFYMTLTKFSW